MCVFDVRHGQGMQTECETGVTLAGALSLSSVLSSAWSCQRVRVLEARPTASAESHPASLDVTSRERGSAAGSRL